jgi:hypothetical protein
MDPTIIATAASAVKGIVDESNKTGKDTPKIEAPKEVIKNTRPADTSVTQHDPTVGASTVDYQAKPSRTSALNEAFKNFGDKVSAAWNSDTGKDIRGAAMSLANSAISSAAQPQQAQIVQPAFTGTNITTSDEKTKENKNRLSDGEIIPEFAQIDAFLYDYTPEAQEEYAGTGAVNDKRNFGIMAQDLQDNPLTNTAVVEDDKGKLAIDGSRLSTINTAVISELCRKVMELESIVYGRG